MEKNIAIDGMEYLVTDEETIRQGDELIRSKGIRKKNLDSIRPLNIGEQTRCFKLVELHKSKLK